MQSRARSRQRPAPFSSLTPDSCPVLRADGHVRGRASIAERHPQGALDLPVRERIIGRRGQEGPRRAPVPGASTTMSARRPHDPRGPDPPIPHEYAAEVRADEVNSLYVASFIPAPDHGGGGLNAGPGRSC